MKCVFCGYKDSKVIDSRNSDEQNSIRRRRECLKCGKRFTTYEMVASTPILVVKNGGSIQTFDPQKIKSGIIKACEKRPVSMNQIDDIVLDIERQINNSLAQEVKSAEIGEMVMNKLKAIDEISYVRFAAVYRKFKDITTFISFLNNMN